MAINFGDIASFATGVVDADSAATAERLVDRRAELQADREMHISMKSKKYESELKAFEAEDKKFKAINSVNAKFEGSTEKVAPSEYGKAYLMETNPNLLLQYETLFKDNPNALNAKLATFGNDSVRNFKTSTTRETLDNKLELDIANISLKYKTQLEAARGDSKLIKAILGKRDSDIAVVVKENEDGANGTLAAKEIALETDTTNTKGFTFADKEKQILFIPKTFKDSFEVDIKKAREIDYSSKEYNKKISDTVLTLIPKTKHKDFYTVDAKNGTLIAKPSIINADITIQALMNNSLKDTNVNDTYTLTNGDKSKIDLSTNTRYDKVKNHVSEYGSWYADGKVLNGGSIKNLLKSTSTALVVPSNSIINLNDNTLKGYNITIDKSLRKDVGKVYKNFIDATARERMQTAGGTLEQNINALQLELQNDNNGKNKLTQDARTYIALALKDVTESNGDLKYPSLTAKDTKTTETNIVDKSTADIKQEEISSGKIDTDLSTVRTVTVTINGKQENVPLTEKNKKILEANNIAIPAVKEDAMTGDGNAMEKVANETVVEKIKPIDVGSDNQSGYFETLDSIQAILPNDMSGQEIMDKYNISFPINKNTKYKPSK